MKRIFTVLAVAALMAAMMALTAMPAFADGSSGGGGGECTNSTKTNYNVLPLLNGLQLLNGNACGNGLIGIAL